MASSSNEFVDDVLRNWVTEYPSVFAYVVINQEGIPLKFSESLPSSKAVQYAALVTDFIGMARRSMKDILGTDGDDFEGIRIRTVDATELIVVSRQYAHGKDESAEFTLVAVQSCRPDGLPPYQDEKQAADAQEGS